MGRELENQEVVRVSAERKQKLGAQRTARPVGLPLPGQLPG